MTTRQTRRSSAGLLIAASLLCGSCETASGAAFVSTPQRPGCQRTPALRASPDDEISRQLERARELLAVSKAKLDRMDDTNGGGSTASPSLDTDVPFFASTIPSSKRDKVVKSRNEKTGLITTDGEKMAKLSEDEEWEVRSLTEVFESEIGELEDVYSLASRQLAERDVTASIFNLRKQMKTEDYRRIFDTRNRFIGEDT